MSYTDLNSASSQGKKRPVTFLLEAPMMARGLDFVARVTRPVLGTATAVAALSLWLVPGSGFEADIFAMKAVVTIALLAMSFAFWRSAVEAAAPEVHVDFANQEVRLVERRGRDTIIRVAHRFSELGGMHVEDNALHLYMQDGAELAVVALDPATEARLSA